MEREAIAWVQRPGTALVVVDMQNDFVDPRGALPVPGAVALLDPINELIRTSRGQQAPVAYTLDWHPPKTRHFQAWGGPWPVHAVAGTWGASLHPDLLVAGPGFMKGLGQEDGYSGWWGCLQSEASGMMARPAGEPLTMGIWLERHGARAVVITGVATEHCVAATALDALQAGHVVVIPQDCCAAVDGATGEAALERLSRQGAVLLEAG